MKKSFLACFSVLLLLVTVPTVGADSPVWKVAKGDNHLFIGGTVHVLSQDDYPLPEAFEKAYSASSVIVFEADIQELQTPEFQKALLSRTSYPEDRNLLMFLTDDTQEHLTQFLASRQIPMDKLVKFKAGMVSITLTMVELQRLGLTGTGVDQFYSLRALNDGKETGHLETADEQLAFLATMGEGQEDVLIAYTLRQMEDLPELMHAMKDAWRTGDNTKMEEVALKSIQKDFPEVTDQFVTDRNDAWLPKIEAMFQTDDVEFVLVGALHLVGENGLIKQLKEKGYAVENF
jgi:uncharacterized protein